MRDDECKIELKCDDIHEWAHACLRDLSAADLLKAHALGNKILEMMDEIPENNAVKFLAVFEVLSLGTQVLDRTTYRPGTTATIN